METNPNKSARTKRVGEELNDVEWEQSMRTSLRKKGVEFKDLEEAAKLEQLKNTLLQNKAKAESDNPNLPDLPPDEALAKEAQALLMQAWPDPVVFLNTFDEDLRNGTYSLYGWQVRALMRLKENLLNNKILKFSILAVNGSGKDRFILAGFITWAIVTQPNVKFAVTTASAAQLDTQTERYIGNLSRAVNAFFRCEVIDIKKRNIKSTANRSKVILFATDDGGKVEGHHPEYASQKLVIIVNEAKTVSQEIMHGLERCTGWGIKLYISSPGAANGAFYNSQINQSWARMKILAADCPHFTPEVIQDLINEHGASHPLVRSMLYAEFGSENEQCVIPVEMLNNCLKQQIIEVEEEFNTAGLDLAAGGNENVATIRNGNVVLDQYWFATKNTMATAREMDAYLRRWQVKPNRVFADAGGVGIGILDAMATFYNWKGIRYVINSFSPSDARAYYNLGTENFFHLRRLVEESMIIIKLRSWELLKKQIITRMYKIRPSDGRYTLEPKPEAIAKGRPSPDRADSLVLAFCDYRPPSLMGGNRVKVNPLPKDDALHQPLTIKNLLASQNQKREGVYGGLSPIIKRDLSRLGITVKETI